MKKLLPKTKQEKEILRNPGRNGFFGSKKWIPENKNRQPSPSGPMFSFFNHCRHHKWLLGGVCGVYFGDEKGFHVGFNIKLPWGKVLPSTTVHNHGITDMTTSLSLMSLYSHCWPLFCISKGTCSIYTSWATPLCLGLVQFLQLAAKEHKR